jgi:E3 ubiquitin-protein ligase HUWE1
MFVGKLVGKAIYDLHLCDLHFSRVIFKLIVGKPITFEDLEQIEPSLYLSMNQIMQLEDASVLDVSFVAEDNDFGSNNTYELIENGENIIVDEKNKHKFVELYSKYKLIDSVRPQLEKFLDGLHEIIPKEYLTIFNEKEIELLLCGSPELNLEDWKKHTKLEGFDKSSMFIVDEFWKMVENMDSIQRSKLLQFVTGTASCPHEGFEGIYPNFTLCRLRVNKDHLPVAHTCLNRLDLPDYDSQEVIVEKFTKAIELGLKEGFQLD